MRYFVIFLIKNIFQLKKALAGFIDDQAEESDCDERSSDESNEYSDNNYNLKDSFVDTNHYTQNG